MVGVSERTNTAGLLGTRSRELVLRVCGGPRDGHVVRLASTKCAVGSAANCTLRLRGAGVQPLHCLILRGAERTTIRSWSRDTRLNGRAFHDALLEAGDRLSVGPLEFDVVETGSEAGVAASSDRSANAAQTIAEAAPQDAATAALLQANREEIARLRAELEAEQAAFETRMREQIDAFESQRTAWESNGAQSRRQGEIEQGERLAAIEAREADLRAREEQLSQQLEAAQQHQSQLELERGQFGEERRQIEGQLGEINSVRAELARQTEELASQQHAAGDFQQRLAQDRADLQVRREELDGLRSSLEAQRAELESQLQGFETRRAELDRQANELEQSRQEFAAQRDRETQNGHEAEQLRTHYEAEQARLSSELDKLTERLAAAEQLIHSVRTEKEADEQRIAAFEQQVAEFERQLTERDEQLTRQSEQLASHARQSEEQTQRSIDLGKEVAERDRRLMESESELQSLREKLASGQGEIASSTDQQSQIEAWRISLEQAAQKVEFEQAALETARRQWEEERASEESRRRDDQERQVALESRLRNERETLADLRQELEKERQAIELLRGALKPDEPAPAVEELTVAQLLRDRSSDAASTSDSNAEAAEEVGFSTPKAEAPLSTSDLFRRLGIAADTGEGEESDADSRQASGPGANERSRHVSRPELPPVVPVAAQSVAEDREESIEEYMQKLLQRSRRAGDLPVTPASYAPTPVVEEKPPIVAEPSPKTPSTTDPAEIQRPVRPRPTSAETAKDLSGLREIANLSARGAIATFDRKKRKSAVIGSTTLAICTLTLGIVLSLMGQHEPLLLYCGLAGIVFGLFTTLSATIATVRFRQIARPVHQQSVDTESRDDATTDQQPATVDAVATAEIRDAQ